MADNFAILGTKFVSQGADKLNSDLNKYNSNAKKASSSNKELSSSFSKLKGVMAPLAGLFAGLSVLAIGKNFFDISKRVEDFRSSLVSVTADTAAYKQQLALLEDITTKVPLNMAVMEKAFIALNGVGITPTAEMLEAFANAASITTDKTGAMTAAVTVWSRSLQEGAVSLEELDKLSDRGIPVYKIIQKELGVTRSKLLEFSREAGNTALVLDTLQNAFLNNDMFSGAAKRDLDTTNGQLEMLGANWDKLVVKLSEASNSSSVFTGVLKGLNSTLVFLAENASTVVNILTGFAAAGVALGIAKVTTMIWGMVKAFKGLKFAIASTGIGAIAIAFGVVVTAAMEYIDRLTNKWSTGTGKIVSGMNIIQATWSVITDNMGNAWSMLTGKITGQWEAVKQLVSGDMSWADFSQVFDQFAAISPLDAFVGTGDKIKAEAIRLGQTIQEGVNDGIKSASNETVINLGVPVVGELERDIENLRKLAEAASKGKDAYKAMSNEVAISTALLKVETDAKKDGVAWNESISASVRKLLEEKQRLNDEIEKEKENWRQVQTPLKDYSKSLMTMDESMEAVAVSGFKALEDSMVGLIMGTSSVGEAFRSLANTIISELARAAIQAAIIKPLLASFGFANGGVISGGQQVTAYAKGGVVDSPTVFPMAKGIGLMGEAGPEAIMPLTRTGSGELGVRTSGTMGQVQVANNFVNNIVIQTSDTDSLSDPKVMDSLSKQIARGQQAQINEVLRKNLKTGGMLNPGMTL